MKEIILSICIPLHNRSKTVIRHMEDILKVRDERYDIVISDTSDDGEDLLSVWGRTSPKVKVFRSDATTPGMKNWKSALDYADGIFAFHLNDRDVLKADHLIDLIDFLETHREYSGGVCKTLKIYEEPILFESREEAFLNIPFFATHITGMIFNTSQYKRLCDIERYFSSDYGIHPHDIIMGKLSENGKMFVFTNDIWEYASRTFYKENKSFWTEDKKIKNYFFDPKERLYELKKNIDEVSLLSFENSIKKVKTDQMVRTYLRLSTNAYFYVMESDFETAHYGIEKERFGLLKRYKFSMNVLDLFDRDLHFTKKQKKEYRRWLTKTIMIPLVAKYTSRIKNQKIRNMLREFRLKKEAGDNAIIR